jgi:hypothetical protein
MGCKVNFSRVLSLAKLSILASICKYKCGVKQELDSKTGIYNYAKTIGLTFF